MSRRIIGGLHSVRAALKHEKMVLALWVDVGRRDRRLRELIADAKSAGVSPRKVSREELDRLAPNTNHQGVVAEIEGAAAGDEHSLENLLNNLDEPPFLLVLDGVQDPHNLGACLRSANAAGIHAVIAPKDKSVGLTPVAVKVASGAAESTPFIQVTNLARTLKKLADDFRIWIVGLAGVAETSLYQVDLKGPLALVMGSEGEGMRRLTREHCDVLAALPMKGSVGSLNVSVASGVTLFEALRHRG